MAKIGMIGVGNMGSSIVKNLLKDESNHLFLHDHFMDKLEEYAGHAQVNLVNKEDLGDIMLSRADYVFLAVKPNQLEEVLRDLELGKLNRSLIWVSMAAGVTLEWLGQKIPSGQPIIRMMPNTPVAVGQGYIAFAGNEHVTESQKNDFQSMMASTGLVEEIEEGLLDVVTGMAGSSPAFIYRMIEAMADAGVSEGLSRAQSYRMAAQAVKGSASMVLETGQHPGVLKDHVTSPGGTTISGLLALEEAGFSHAIQAGVKAAIKRSRDMQA